MITNEETFLFENITKEEIIEMEETLVFMENASYLPVNSFTTIVKPFWDKLIHKKTYINNKNEIYQMFLYKLKSSIDNYHQNLDQLTEKQNLKEFNYYKLSYNLHYSCGFKNM